MKPSDILYIIFPVIGNLETNYKLRKRLNTNSDQAGEQLQTPLKQSSNPDAITIKSLKEQYANALEVKDKFEGEAKAIGSIRIADIACRTLQLPAGMLVKLRPVSVCRTFHDSRSNHGY